MSVMEKDDYLYYIDEALERLLLGQYNSVAGVGHENLVFSSIDGKLEKLAYGMSKIHSLIERLDCGELAENFLPQPSDVRYWRWHGMIQLVEKRVEELEESLVTDGITGMLNRQRGLRAVERRLSESLPSERHCLAFIDLDDLKRINDNFGHSAGDTFILSVSEVILSSIRCSDIAVRYGGDEFIVFLDGYCMGMAVRKLREMRSALNEINLYKALPYRMDFSCGIVSNQSCQTADLWNLINLADRRMYADKQRRYRLEPLLRRERRMKYKARARLK